MTAWTLRVTRAVSWLAVAVTAAVALPPAVARNIQSLRLVHGWAAGASLTDPAPPAGGVFRQNQDRLFRDARKVLCADEATDGRSLDAACAEALTWRTPWSDRLAEALSQRTAVSNAPVWRFALGDLYHRRHDVDRARANYEALLSEGPVSDEVQLRLALLAEATAAGAADPARWRADAERRYRDYRTRVPTDLFSLERLATLCRTGACADATALDAEWEKAAGDVTIAMGLLGRTTGNAIVLGPPWASPDWRFVWFSKAQLSYASPSEPVVGGRDPLGSIGRGETLRVDGLRAGQASPAGVAGSFTTRLKSLQPDVPFLLTFFYKSRGCRRDDLSLATPLVEEGSVSLPATSGAWWKAALVIWPDQAEAELRLTNAGACQGWFAGVRAQTLRIDGAISLDSLPTRLGRRAVGAVSGIGWTRGWWTVGS